MPTILMTGSQSSLGRALRQRLEKEGHQFLGIDTPGSGADIEADLGSLSGRRDALEEALRQVPKHGLRAFVAGMAAPLHHDPVSTLRSAYFGPMDLLLGLHARLAMSPVASVILHGSADGLLVPQPSERLVEAMTHMDESAACAMGAGLQANPLHAYSAASRAMACFVRAHAGRAQWAGTQIPLNAILTGPCPTDHHIERLKAPSHRHHLQHLPCPMEALPLPHELTGLFGLLLSRDARFLVGQVLVQDSGAEVHVRGQHTTTAPPYHAEWMRRLRGGNQGASPQG